MLRNLSKIVSLSLSKMYINRKKYIYVLYFKTVLKDYNVTYEAFKYIN